MKKILQLLSGHPSYDQIRIIQPFLKVRDMLKVENIAVQCTPMQQATTELLQQFDITCVHGCCNLAIYPTLKQVKFSIWVDDLMTNLPECNPAKPTEEEVRGLKWCHETANSVVCTTPYLQNTFKRDKVLVAPNLIDIKRAESKSPNVLYSFGNSHNGDLELLGDMQTKRNMYFFGHSLPNKFCNYQKDKTGQIELFPNQENILYVPLQRDYEKYQVWMKNLEFGVGLCPLEDNEFNCAKSVLKVGEYLQHGAVSVVSDVGSYKGIPDECVVKVKENDWDAAVEYAFAHHRTIYNAAYDWWMGNFSYQKQIKRWVEVYRNL